MISSGPHVVYLRNQTPIFEWYMMRLIVKSGHQMTLSLITLEAKINMFIKLSSRALHWVPMPMPTHTHGFWVGMHGCDVIVHGWAWVGIGFVHPCIQLQIGVKLIGCREYANQEAL